MEQDKKKSQNSPLNLPQIWQALLKHKKIYLIGLPLAFVVACIYNLAFPNVYTCTVKLAPELNSRTTRSSGALGSIVSRMGFNLGSNGNADALYPTLYPDLMNSVDFKTSLFPIEVAREGETKTMSYYDYLAKEQKRPWWSNIIRALLSKKDTARAEEKVDPFKLTKKQTSIVQAINKKVICSVNEKTMVISIAVTDQDPLIAATVADSVRKRLQAFITSYRTSKARVDLEFNRKLFQEAKARYEKARQDYANYADANQDVILESVRSKQTDLENEMQLQYNIYTQVTGQLQTAEARVQEETPAFTTLQSATVPVLKSGPARAKKVIVFTLSIFVLLTCWILYKEKLLKSLLGF